MELNENSLVRIGGIVHVVHRDVALEITRLQNIEQAAQITRLVIGHVVELIRSAAGVTRR